MTKVFRDDDIDDSILRKQTVGILGYGNQGRVHALNLKDGGFRVVVGLRDGSPRFATAREDGMQTAVLQEAAENAEFLVFAVPDLAHASVYAGIQDDIKPGAALCFLHGFSVHYGLVRPRADLGVVLTAPKGIAEEFRKRYLGGGGVPGVIGVAQDASGDSLARALAYGKGIGCARAGLYLSSFREETEADLFTEQALLCGGVPFLVQKVFDALVNAGFSEEIAYFETIEELKLIVDLLRERGPSGMFRGISPTAHFGALRASGRLEKSGLSGVVSSLLADIRSGEFAGDLLSLEHILPGLLTRRLEETASSRLEEVWVRLRPSASRE
jgi:ketol-acid reductoisomerase